MLEYGAVIITKGKYKGRIGYYDDENDTGKKGIIYWGDMVLCLDGYDEIPLSYLSNDIPTFGLLNRIKQLQNQIGKMRASSRSTINYPLCTQLLSELLLAKNILNEKYINLMYLKPFHHISVFISHSSNDLEFSRCLATDLKEIGYDVF